MLSVDDILSVSEQQTWYNQTYDAIVEVRNTNEIFFEFYCCLEFREQLWPSGLVKMFSVWISQRSLVVLGKTFNFEMLL